MARNRDMLDSTTVTDIPLRYRGRKVKMVLGYADGKYRTMRELRRRFPKALHVPVTVIGDTAYPVADRETGDITAREAATWAKNRSRAAAGSASTIYVNLSSLSAVARMIDGSNTNVYFLTAHWNGKRHICNHECLKPYHLPPWVAPRVIGTQYADPAMTGGHFDASLVKSYWPGIDRNPRHPSTPAPKRSKFYRAFLRWLRNWRTNHAA